MFKPSTRIPIGLLIIFVSNVATFDYPSLENPSNFTESDVISFLTHGMRYDRFERPNTNDYQPTIVFIRVHILFMENLETNDNKFKLHALQHLQFVDSRLNFEGLPFTNYAVLTGEKSLKERIWTPHIFLANEDSSRIFGLDQYDVLTSIAANGTVIISTRFQASLHCLINVQKFPFDEQTCTLIYESWLYNTSEVILQWATDRPASLAPELNITEFSVMDFWTNESNVTNQRNGSFMAIFSSASYSISLIRQSGFSLLMDYFLPSIMIVATSWVSFWIQVDQAAPRLVLGTSTLLTFFTLASIQRKALPKVSYLKMSEVWFVGCALFIFVSLMEFAYVHIVSRRRHRVEDSIENPERVIDLTPQELAYRVDLRSRFGFPCCFLIFNICYWMFVFL